MDYVYAVMSEMERKLDRQIRDLDDVRLVMDTLKKIREQEVDMELRIEPIEVKYGFVLLYILQRRLGIIITVLFIQIMFTNYV